MSLEYAIEFPCEMRRQYGEREMRTIGRAGALVSRIVSQTLETDRPPSTESIEFTASLSEDLEKSETIAAYCRHHCPAHIDETPDRPADHLADHLEAGFDLPRIQESEPVGCLGRIRYPIEGHFERFVADRVQLICDTVPVENWPSLLRILVDPESPFDGELTKELRRVTTEEGLRFFELRLPISLARGATRLTTDNVFDLFSGFSITDGGQSGYERELPVAALPDYREFLEAVLLNDLMPPESARLRARSTTYAQFVRFTRAVQLAESLKVRILMD